MGKVKSAIYYYFPDKESLLRAVIDEEIGKLIRSIKDAVERASTPEESLEYTLSLEALKLDACRRSTQDSGGIRSTFPLVKEIHERYDHFERDTLKGILEVGMELGHFNKTDSEVLADTILLWLKV